MSVDRRDFLMEASAALLGFGGFTEIALAQTPQSQVKVDTDVVDFWVRSMGLAPNTVIGGSRTRGRQQNGPSLSDLGREPLFLHYDPEQEALITTDQIKVGKLAESGDTDVQFQMVRMRLNGDDDRQFRSYSSLGMYVDFQQAAKPQMSVTDYIGDAASAAISAAFPPAGKSGGGKAQSGGGKDNSGGKSGPAGKGKGKNFLPDMAADDAGTGSSIPLQAASQSQSFSLTGGAGRHSFACFAKDKHKSLFGQFVSVFSTLANSAAASYLPLLSMPVIGPPALAAIRSLMANLQAHGGDQQWIMMSPPVDLVTTQEGAKGNPGAMLFPSGNYIMIPKAHSAAMKGELNKLKVLDGFLVPKEAGPLEVYDAHAGAAPGVSYISVSVGVQPSKKGAGRGCK
ncbi:MAG TPA: hypothetical protein VNY05_10075 [Candidatus Acidoferrales bacterium]|jgi:hypothetical protein|nr:hypothetical protein [Candidatus Acidoferrales bacterium]